MASLIKIITILFLFLIFFNIIVSTFRLPFHVYGGDDASSKIAEADNVVKQAFVATLEAEKTGANVSTLVAKLNEAEQLLTEANFASKVGNYSGAIQLAEQCLSSVNDVAEEAASLKSAAEKSHEEKLIATVVVTCSGLSLLFILSMLGWRFLKGRRLRRMLKMKPELVKIR